MKHAHAIRARHTRTHTQKEKENQKEKEKEKEIDAIVVAFISFQAFHSRPKHIRRLFLPTVNIYGGPPLPNRA